MQENNELNYIELVNFEANNALSHITAMTNESFQTIINRQKRRTPRRVALNTFETREII